MKQLLALALVCGLATPALAQTGGDAQSIRKIVTSDLAERASASFQDVRMLRSRDSGEILYCGKVDAQDESGSHSGYHRFLALADNTVLIEKSGDDPLVLLDNDMISNAWTHMCVDGPMSQALGPVSFK